MLRVMHKNDIDQLLVIEEAVHIVPWNRDTFLTCFQAGYTGWVVELEKRIIGFIVVSAQLQECHILNVCVARDHQHQGWGRKLMQQVLTEAKQNNIGIAYLEVRRSNTPAISLYKTLQFQLIGERKDYYPTVAGHEDALIFARSLVGTSSI